jgi:probable HAF family extracellular repeat protein
MNRKNLVKWFAVFGICAMSFGLVPRVQAATAYTITDLGTLGGESSYAYGMNDSGQIVGRSKDEFDVRHAFIYEGGVMSVLIDEAASSEAIAINNSGQVTGEMYDNCVAVNSYCSYLFDDDTAIEIDGLGGGNTQAAAISTTGQVVGIGGAANNEYHAFLYEDDVTIDIGTLGGSFSQARGVNAGKVVGLSTTENDAAVRAFVYDIGTEIMSDLGTLPDSIECQADAIAASGDITGSCILINGERHPFLYDGSTMTDLGVLGIGCDTFAVNSVGEVVGTYWTEESVYHAFIYTDSQLNDLNDLIPSESGWVLEQATSINNNGQVVGYGWIDGTIHGFLLDPVVL